MTSKVKIGVVGDFNPDVHTHPAIARALGHSAAKIGVQADVEWVPTPAMQQTSVDTILESFDGLIAAPGSPYRSFDGMMRAIEFARTRNWPFSGT